MNDGPSDARANELEARICAMETRIAATRSRRPTPSDVGVRELPATDFSSGHINECVALLPEWLKEAASAAAREARMFACVAERLASRFSELEMCVDMALGSKTSESFDGGHLIGAVGLEIGLGEVDECLMGAVAIITNACGGYPADDGKARNAALKHAHQHREENGEPLLLRSLVDFYTRARS